MRRVILSIPLVAGLVTSAGATGIVRGQCGKGACDEFEIVEKQVVRSGGDGTLIWARLRQWLTVEGQLRSAPAQKTMHFFCSTSRPAFIVTEDGSTRATMLAPLSPWEYDKYLNWYVTYFEACHDAGNEVPSSREHLARNLRYQVLRIHSSQPLGLTRPESIFYFPSATRRDNA